LLDDSCKRLRIRWVLFPRYCQQADVAQWQERDSASRISGNETAVVKRAAIASVGIAMLPTCFVGDKLRRGELVRVLTAYESETLGIHAPFLSRQHQPLPLKLLVDFLADRFGGNVASWGLPS
jgi:DNA-binding transcriptional LysR family regulator